MDDVTDNAKGAFRRIELLTGPTRRRRSSEAEKAGIVGETLVPGAVVSAIARRWQVCPQQVFGWRRAARAGDVALADEAGEAGVRADRQCGPAAVGNRGRSADASDDLAAGGALCTRR